MPRIALLADIQGNAVALETVFAHAESFQPDAYICLGDVASGAQPHEAITRLRSYNVLTVRGNMDDVLLDPSLSTPREGESSDAHNYHEIDEWGAAQLTQADREFLQGLPLTLTYTLDEIHAILCFHGAPEDYNAPMDARMSESELKRLLNGYSAPMLATGHMHLPMLRFFGETMLVNPGSVGLPFGGKGHNRLMPPQAQYALIEVAQRTVSVNFYTVAYDGEQLKHAILNSGMPHAEWYASLWEL